MIEIERHDESSCGAGCGGCAAGGDGGGDDEPSGDKVLTGWRFGFCAAAMFLAPLALAIAGTVIGGPGGPGELAGGVGGLVIGAVAVALGARILDIGRRSTKAR